ncbi:MAG: LacI family DNA-binding transcriptional regulator [Phycisphaeraceae bacterium JB051]
MHHSQPSMNKPPKTTRDSISTRELAKLANVNQSTVSRSLNGDPRIHPDRAREIRKLAQKYGYRPKPLRSKKTNAIGLLMPSTDTHQPDHPFINRVLLLVEQALAQRGMHIHVAFTPRNSENSDAATVNLPGMILENRVDGILLAGHPDPAIVTRIQQYNLPIVGINDSSDRLGIPTIRLDARQAVIDVITRLHELGHRRIALATHLIQYTTNRMRHDAYQTAMTQLNLKVDDQLILSDMPFGLEGGAKAVDQLMSLAKPPTAMLMGNDWMAMGAMQALTQRGLSVPQDVSLVGHDDLWFCSDPTLNLSSIHRDESELVTQAIEMLIHQIEDDDNATDHPPQERYVPAQVIWRDSVAKAKH